MSTATATSSSSAHERPRLCFVGTVLTQQHRAQHRHKRRHNIIAFCRIHLHTTERVRPRAGPIPRLSYPSAHDIDIVSSCTRLSKVDGRSWHGNTIIMHQGRKAPVKYLWKVHHTVLIRVECVRASTVSVWWVSRRFGLARAGVPSSLISE